MADEVRLMDANALKESLKKYKVKGYNQKYVQGMQDAIDGYFPQIIDDAPTIEAITREQFTEVVKQLMNEFAANDGYGTSASATFLALYCFGNLELRLFGKDSDSE